MHCSAEGGSKGQDERPASWKSYSQWARNTLAKRGTVTDDEPTSEDKDDSDESRLPVTVPKWKRSEDVIE